jgi:hypothetical protein
LAGHHEKHEGPNCEEVVSAFHLNAPLHCLSAVSMRKRPTKLQHLIRSPPSAMGAAFYWPFLKAPSANRGTVRRIDRSN